MAERSPWGLVAIPLFYTGILLALAGLWLGQLVGWSESNVALLPGQPVSLRHDQGLSISLAGEDTGPGELIIRSNKGTTVSGMFSPPVERTYPASRSVAPARVGHWRERSR